jgi:hypothetical protein
MFPSWRLQLREAEQALRDGRLDEAYRLVSQGELRTYLPGRRLCQKVAGQIADRAGRRLMGGQSSEGWRDLETACSLIGEVDEVLAVREAIVERYLRDAEGDIAAGEPSAAIARLEGLRRHVSPGLEMRHLEEVARRLQSARNLGLRGRFADAEQQLARAAALRPDIEEIQRQRTLCNEHLQSCNQLSEQLHKAMAKEDWSETLILADRLLELAPEHPLAQDGRRRAWSRVGAGEPRPPQRPVALGPSRQSSDTTGGVPQQHGPTETLTREAGSRFLLWVDGVGGYLVCFQDQVVLGQAVPGRQVDIPILGDLSRQHARLRREDGYVIEPIHPVCIDGREVRDRTMLNDGNEIQLGSGVRLRFRQPHALSATARLDIVSRHRTQPTADGVLLMAESCVLGPKWQNHVVCREWANDVVLYRRDGELFCRAMEPIEIDGQFCEGQGRLACNSHVTGSDFSLCLEEIA